jgi:hypothetical protein
MDTERPRARSAPQTDPEFPHSLDHEKDPGVGVAPTHSKGGPFAMIHAP